MTLSSTAEFTHKQYSDSLGGNSTHSIIYQGKLGLRLSAIILRQLTPFVTLNYNFGTSQNFVFQTTTQQEKPITFTMLTQPIPSNFGLETGFDYAISDQLNLQSLFDYHQVKGQTEDLQKTWNMAHHLTYRFKENITIEANVKRIEQNNFNYGVSLIWNW